MIDTLTEVEQFYLTYRPLIDHELLRKAIEKHIEYGTITVLQDRKGISALLRFDIVGECLHVLDLIVRQDLERQGMIKLITLETWHKFPYLRFFRFERAKKYHNRPPRAYKISKLIK